MKADGNNLPISSFPLPLRRRARVGGPARHGFTLVELLVVIAIIGILASMLLAAVFKVMGPAYEAQTRTDITQLSVAVQAFETYFKVPYIPSRIILCKFYANYFNPNTNQPWTPLHADSLNYLLRVFPRITSGPWISTGIDWNGDGNMQQDPPMGPNGISVDGGPPVPFVGFALEGEQCLVFFLGGIPQANPDGTFTATGFSTNPSNPAQPGGDRTPPFFDFRSNRLIHWTPPGQPPGYSGTALGFPSYLDGYGKTPYAYFSSYRSSEGQSNGYNRYVNYSNPYLELHQAATGCGPVTTDCQALPYAKGQADPNHLGVFPYAQSMGPGQPPAYLNPRSFQVISAGKDYYFGEGTVICTYPGGPVGTSYWSGAPLWSPGSAATIYQAGQLGGYDDISNFYDRLLGVASP